MTQSDEKTLDNGCKISVIVPVYNAEKYIDKCVLSILNQSFEEFELILVNDGSTDNSGEICDKYAEKDRRVRVIHKPNGGVSSARNSGLEKARGEYIAYIDIDDLIDEKYLETLYNDSVKYHADIVCCNSVEMKSGYDNIRTNSDWKTVDKSRLITDVKTYLDDFFDFSNVGHYELYNRVVWAKIIKKDIAELETFSKIKYGEDTEYMLKLFSHAPKTYLDDYDGYYYIRWDQSATNRKNEHEPMRMLDGIQVADTILKISTANGDDNNRKAAEKYYINQVYSAVSSFIKNKDYALFCQYSDKLKGEISKAAALSSISAKHKILFGLFKLSPKLYWKLVGKII